MEGGRRRSPYTVTFDELIGRKKTEPCSCGFTVFPPTTTTLLEKDSSRVDSTLNNQSTGQIGNTQSQSAAADGKSPSKQQTTDSKDDKLLHEQEEVGYFNSSIYYGGREFYVTSSSNQLFGTAKDKRNDELDNLDNDIIGPRGEWWQGSYHY